MTERYTDRQLRKSAENRNELIPDSFMNKLMNTLDSLPEEPAEKGNDSEQAAVIKHSSSSGTIKMTVSAAAALAIFAGSAAMYGRIRKNTDNSGSPAQSSPVSETVTTVPLITTESSGTSDTSQSETQITGPAFQAFPEAPLPEIITPGSENHDPAPEMPVPPGNSIKDPHVADIHHQDPVISKILLLPHRLNLRKINILKPRRNISMKSLLRRKQKNLILRKSLKFRTMQTYRISRINRIKFRNIRFLKIRHRTTENHKIMAG